MVLSTVNICIIIWKHECNQVCIYGNQVCIIWKHECNKYANHKNIKILKAIINGGKEAEIQLPVYLP